MKERWRDIPGFEGRYQASDHGRVRSLDRAVPLKGRASPRRHRGRVLSLQKFSNGYLFVKMGYGGAHLVHRLVAAAFIDGDMSLQVNHKNGVRSDNRPSNLEWLTQSDNQLHAYRELPRRAHALITPVVVEGKRYESELSAAHALGVTVGSIHSALTRGHKCKGKEVLYAE